MAKVDELFKRMVDMGGSDLHLREGQPPKVRLFGEIVPLHDRVIDHDEICAMMSEAAGPERWKLFQKRGDLDFAYEMDENARFRTNYMRHVHGIGALFRLIPTRIWPLDVIGAPEVAKSFLKMRGGLVLVTGPTGSGKSTTLAAMIDHMNTNYAKHIVTIEEPIEFVHSNRLSVVTQREVPIHAPSFSAGLKAALREDADAILVGEMRDLETIALALTAAETGMVVFGTLHTNNARKTIDRIIDVFPAERQPQIRTMLAASLRGVLAQLLLKRADGKGRIASYEVLVGTSAVSAVIREGKTDKLMDVLISGRSEGMQIMDDSIMNFRNQGIVSDEEAMMKAIDKARFQN
jgi:twitching motility protein PilT